MPEPLNNNGQVSRAKQPVRFAVSATFTAEPIAPALRFLATRIGREPDVRFAPYNQIPQTLHDVASEFANNAGGLNLVLVRIEDLGQFSRVHADSLAQTSANAAHLADSLADAAPGFAAPVLVIICPPSLRFEQGAGAGWNASIAGRVKERLGAVRNLAVVDWRDIAAAYPVEVVENPEGERLGRIPYTEEYFAALALAAVRHWDALTRPPYKVIAVDCDNTLWTGICGEDGPEGVALGSANRRLQELLLAQREAGMVLAMVSKNNEHDVLETFAAHPEFPLQPDHFAAWRLNWQPKEDNLVELAGELNLGLDSFIFIDDNPKECAEVSGAVPEVLTIPLPLDESGADGLPARVWAFDHPIVTEEDRKRSESYGKVRDFAREIGNSASLDDFIKKLGLAVHITELQPPTLPRAAQLTQRTNQFNTTTIRRTEADLEALTARPEWDVYTATVADRFGEYGVTVLFAVESREKELFVDSLMLSCRVLGRGVEHRAMRFAGQAAFDAGLETVAVAFSGSARNAPARQFLDSIPGGSVETSPSGMVYRFSAIELGKLSWTPAASSCQMHEKRPHPESGRLFSDYVGIAASLGTARQVVDALRSEFELRAPTAGEGPATGTEAALARIWAELLRRESVGAADNFFDLGGHSLLAVLLLMRIKEEFGVELPVDDVYSATLTLSELAGIIDAGRLGVGGEEEYEELLRQLEGMSDEEVQALLEQAQSGQQAPE